MKIKYLGTAAAEGYPGLFCSCEYCRKARKLGGRNLRTRSQCIIDDTLLVDYPADSYAHMLKYDIQLPHIHSILITHTHQDHLYLEDLGLRYGDFSHGLDHKLTLYGNDALLRRYNSMYRSDPADTHLDDTLGCTELTEYVTCVIDGYNVTPLLASHDRNEKCLIFLIEKDGTAMLYGNDTGWFPEPTWQFLAGRRLNLISLDCTFMQYAEGTNHMGMPDVIKTCNRLSEMNCILPDSKIALTHFSHNGHMLHNEISALAGRHGYIAAYDGMELVF